MCDVLVLKDDVYAVWQFRPDVVQAHQRALNDLSALKVCKAQLGSLNAKVAVLQKRVDDSTRALAMSRTTDPGSTGMHASLRASLQTQLLAAQSALEIGASDIARRHGIDTVEGFEQSIVDRIEVYNHYLREATAFWTRHRQRLYAFAPDALADLHAATTVAKQLASRFNETWDRYVQVCFNPTFRRENMPVRSHELMRHDTVESLRANLTSVLRDICHAITHLPDLQAVFHQRGRHVHQVAATRVHLDLGRWGEPDLMNLEWLERNYYDDERQLSFSQRQDRGLTLTLTPVPEATPIRPPTTTTVVSTNPSAAAAPTIFDLVAAEQPMTYHAL